MSFSRTIVVSAALAMAAAAPLAAQQEPVGAQQQATPAPAQVQAWAQEAQQIGRRLAAVQQQALSDPELARERDELTARVEQAMAEIDPALQRDMAGATELEPMLEAAQQAGDTARMQEVLNQARELEARFVTAQETALADPELSRVVLAFNERMRARMTELEPQTPELLDRLMEIRTSMEGRAN